MKKQRENKFYRKWWFWLIVILIILGSIGANMKKNNTENNIATNKQIEDTTQKDLSKIIYEDDKFLVKITDYEYSKITNTIKINIYIENNSNKDTTFVIDGDVSINSFMVKGGYFYQEVNANTKSKSSFTVSNLKDNNISESNLEKMQFKLDIYQSKNYMIENRIADDLQVIYEF